jgi:hypothetical protein
MAGNHGTSDRTLVAGRRDHYDPPTQSEIERLLKTAPASRRWAFEGDAQIDDPRPATDNFEYGVGKLCGGCVRHLLAIGGRFREDRSNQKSAARADRGGHRHTPCVQYSRDKCAVSARRVPGIGACRCQFTRDLADVFGGEVGVVERDRPVDQADRDFGSAAGARHQLRQPDQV